MSTRIDDLNDAADALTALAVDLGPTAAYDFTAEEALPGDGAYPFKQPAYTIVLDSDSNLEPSYVEGEVADLAIPSGPGQ